MSHSLSRSYRANLQSSFNTIILYTYVYSTNPPVSVYSTVLFWILHFFQKKLKFFVICVNQKTSRFLSCKIKIPLAYTLIICLRDRLNKLKKYIINYIQCWIENLGFTVILIINNIYKLLIPVYTLLTPSIFFTKTL